MNFIMAADATKGMIIVADETTHIQHPVFFLNVSVHNVLPMRSNGTILCNAEGYFT